MTCKTKCKPQPHIMAIAALVMLYVIAVSGCSAINNKTANFKSISTAIIDAESVFGGGEIPYQGVELSVNERLELADYSANSKWILYDNDPDLGLSFVYIVDGKTIGFSRDGERILINGDMIGEWWYTTTEPTFELRRLK